LSRGEEILEQETLLCTRYAPKVFNCYEACLKTILRTRDLTDLPEIFQKYFQLTFCTDVSRTATEGSNFESSPVLQSDISVTTESRLWTTFFSQLNPVFLITISMLLAH
jgi:hypothetical protein